MAVAVVELLVIEMDLVDQVVPLVVVDGYGGSSGGNGVFRAGSSGFGVDGSGGRGGEGYMAAVAAAADGIMTGTMANMVEGGGSSYIGRSSRLSANVNSMQKSRTNTQHYLHNGNAGVYIDAATPVGGFDSDYNQIDNVNISPDTLYRLEYFIAC